MSKKQEFNNFRFEGLNYRDYSNNYMTMNRVSDDENKIVIKVDGAHLKKTRFGYAFILDYSNVVFLKEWQVEENYYGFEVLLNREYFNIKKWGTHEDFAEADEKELTFEKYLSLAKTQEDDNNQVQWRKRKSEMFKDY